uniref:Wide awake, isoform C n=2 Tax=Drosophila melanogaster TaxID=7227 RepID=A0A0B4K6W6_DROME|nr:wide awake, isoform C [Drosophila melanogaster]AFH06561.1 wide awake, isoform C [Drosophila melanogaster]|eukprot:NP_001247243.1 wide awake, isoform C [Drosophila melanogaster]
MERRKALSSYAKFKDQQEAAAAVTPQKDNESDDSLPALRRSHSVRSSLRRLKNKLHSPALSMQSPFKLRTQLHMRNRSSRGSATLDKSKAAKALRMLGDLDAVAVLTTKVKGKNEFVPLKRAMNSDSCDHDELGIERLMSSLPVGAKLPRKACKLLQIPESYCRQAEVAPKATLDSDLEKTFSGEESSAVLADITRHAQQGIYGTTRMRTATIRKPMPYLNSHNILPQDKRDGDIDSVRLREKVVNPSGGNNNNQDNYPTYYPAPLLSTSRWSEQLTQHAAVAKIRTAISCHSQDLREMEFLLPHSRTDSQSNSQSQLCISRHSQPKNAKLRDDHDETGSSELDSPPLGDENASANGQLSVHRQPVQLRSKIPGNTPHPRASKMSKKQLKLAQAQLDKLTQNNLHLHALFSAVEHGHLEKARTILESTDVDVNSINNDGLSALDLAVLSNNRSMTRMLLQHGAVEGSQFSVDTIGTKLNGLLKDAESRIHDLSGPEGLCPPVFASRPSISSIIIGNSSASVTGCTGSEVEKQIGIWERRVKGLRRLQLGWDQARPPDAPASVVVDVTGDNSISVQILEPFEGAIGTKFKVQWSTRADFNNVVGESELLEWISFHGTMGAQCHISGLTQGRRYFLRAACGNVKGWGTYRTSVPASVVPSTWRDLDNREDRFVGRHRILDNLFTAVRLARPADVSELTLDPASAQRRNPKKKTTIKQLFSVTTKFQKTLRRGIYFSCIIHCDDKVLVTSEDFPPVIEVDESYPSALHMDYYWLMKVACTWEDVKSLRSDMERNLTSAVHFRTKLLSAVCQMQSALGITDLGQLYYKPLRDAQGTVVLTCVQSVKSQKAVSILNSRWVPVSKLQKKLGALHEDYTINELLISSIGDQLHYQQAALQRLEPGLYLGYLKMQCSIDQIQVVVPVKTPNVLPHCKVRENSHITAEEWQVLHRYSSDPLRLPLDFSAQGGDGASGATATTEVQRLFLYDLTNAMHKLFASMNIKIADATTHRLYDVEVIEHSPDISFLVVCPSAESSCAVPGQSELLLQRDDLASLSIQAFEMIHLRTYQPAIIQKYARLSCILELDTALATHSLREAFSSSELQAAKERLATLQELSASLTIVWKSVRWLMDVVAYARNKNAQPSLAMREILDFAQQRQDEAVATSAGGSANKQLLQLPIRESKFSKTGQGRGSWPGPGTSEDQSQNKPEHSKSEQNLELSAITPVEPASNQVPTQQQQPQQQSQQQQLLQVSNISEYAGSICSEVSFRKNSGDSMSSTYTSRSFYSAVDSASDGNSTNSVFAIPPSRSDDTLADALRHSQAVAAQRKRTSSNIASHTNPLITVHSSSSAPYLAGSSVSLRSGNGAFATDLEHKPLKPATKAASSANLREGGPYLKSTLAELRAVGGEEPVASTSKASSMKSLSRQSSEEDSASCSSLNAEQTSGIIQVYTAYSTGLASGTSLKIHVTPKTTAREVINLVVKQLNMAVVLKGNNGPIYGPEMLENFCLVAVIGARERCLRDDFKPLQLQNPWKKGRLYVRKKHELLAAIEHSNRKSHLI